MKSTVLVVRSAFPAMPLAEPVLRMVNPEPIYPYYTVPRRAQEVLDYNLHLGPDDLWRAVEVTTQYSQPKG